MSEMEINTQQILTERKRRAWSQQHLADASGLSLRTVQRIENTGRASVESVKAIASVFELPAEQLFTSKQKPKPWKFFTGITTFIAAAAAAMFVSLASAEPVMLNVEVHEQENELAIAQILDDEGAVSEIRVESLKFEFVSYIAESDHVEIQLKIYQKINQDYELLAEPILHTAHRQMASIKFDVDGGKQYTVNVTPNI